MAEQQYYLCFETSLNEKEIDLVCKYWEIKEVDGEDGTQYFRYKITDLERMFGVKKISIFVKDSAFIVSNSDKGKCLNCGKKQMAKVRSHFAQISKVKRLPCNDCQRMSINIAALEKIQKINTGMEIGIHQPEFRMAELESLGYIDTLVLLVMILDISSLDEFPIQLEREALNLLGSDDLDEKYLRDLYTNNAILVVDENQDTQAGAFKEIGHFLARNSEFVNADTWEMYYNCEEQINKPGIYCNIPVEFKDLNEYKEYLFDEVTNATIVQEDVALIKDLVLNNRLRLAYSLLTIVKNKWNIPVDMGVRLDSVLLAAVTNHPIPVVYNMFNYQAEKIAAEIHSSRDMPPYIKEKLFSHHVERQMSYLEKTDKTPYEKYLPDYIVNSKIEDFTSYYVMGELMSWTDLSTDELVSRWLNSSTIQIQE